MAKVPVRWVYVIYLLSVMFVALFTTAGAVAEIGGVVAREAVDQEPIWAITVGTGFANYEPIIQETQRTEFIGPPTDRLVSELLRAGLVGLLGLTVFEFHRRQWKVLLRRESGDG